MDLNAILAQVNFFQGLSDGSRRALADRCFPKSFRRRETIFREGDPGRAIYLLNRGTLQLFKTAPDGSEIVIKTVPAGEVFAEVVLFERERYPVTARALTECHLFLFLKQDILRLLGREEFRNDFIAMLLAKQRYLADRILYLTNYDAEQRLFLFLREQYGTAPSFHVPISKKDVAAAIGTTPETLSRLLLRLDRDDRLHWKGRQVTVTGDWRPVGRPR